MMYLLKACCTVLFASCIAGCASYSNLYGPSPVIKADDASRSTSNYIRVRNEFIERAGYAVKSPNIDWYEVTLAGFGYVDEKCSQYLAGLYEVRRQRDYIRSQFAAAGTSSNAILAAARAGETAISITAASIGLASQLSDNFSASILYSMDPSDIDTMLHSQMQAYRNGVASQRTIYTSSNTSMDAIRGYLDLCLPVSIDGQIKATLQSTHFIGAPSNTGVPQVARLQTSSPVIEVPTIKEVRHDGSRVRPTKPSSLALNTMPGDIAVTPDQAKMLQSKLCLPADGDLGKTGSKTRIALGDVQTEKLKRPATWLLDDATWSAANALPICDPAIHHNSFEHIVLPDQASVNIAQLNLKNHILSSASFTQDDKGLVGKPDFVGGDRLTPDNRSAIKAIQRVHNLTITGEYGSTVSDLILP